MKRVKLYLGALLGAALLVGCGSVKGASKQIDLSEVVITRYSAEDNVFATDKKEFYSRFLTDSVDKKIAFGKDEDKNPKKAWEKQIEESKKALEDKFPDSNKPLVSAVDEAWNAYEADCESLNKALYGVDGVIHGSMYSEILPFILEKEYGLYAGSLMAAEYELTGEYTSELSFVDRDSDVSSAKASDFSAGTLCLEWDEEFRDIVEDIGMDTFAAEEIGEMLESFAEELDSKADGATNAKAWAADYIVLVDNMKALEVAATDDEARCEKVREQRLKLAVEHLLSVFKVLES